MRILSLLVVLFILPASADDFSSFDTPPGTEWTSFSPLAPLYPASFSYSNSECRITCPTPDLSTAMNYGGARGGLFAPGVMLDSA